MKKRVVSIILFGLMLLTMVGCGNTDKKDESTNNTETAQVSNNEEKEKAEEPVKENKQEEVKKETVIEPVKEEVDLQNTKIEDKKTQLVWITTNGKKYHLNKNCSNMKNPSQVSIDSVGGRTPCSKCAN
ncbi:hypothetical protein [Clostridium paraputrificum]|uniref:hypothetical protein n=1 Tax=Clostridium paraputrificum TaxID=29363 RepID=UPI0018974D5C|nr:hypothetical protein [Clostridium paraputrificum]MDB2123714.1 hypothetical protein [Clostridium paraputrificum]